MFCVPLRMLIFEPISQFFAMVMMRTHTDGDHSVSVQLQVPFRPVDLLGIPDSPSTLLTTLGLSTKLLIVSMLGSFMGYVSSKKAPLWMLMCMADLGPGENREDLRTLHWGVCCFERRSKIPSKVFEAHYIGDVRVGLHVCKAKNHGDLIYTAFGPCAPHRGCLVTNVDFLLEGCRPNSWIRLPGFHLSRYLQIGCIS